jgi:mannose-6-phosphate isomerase-like protein (cupin superfamily)
MSEITAAGARRIEKPWGYELVWAHTDRYVGKILHINAGEALSLQYHRVKDETLHLLSGRLQLEAADGEGPLRVFELRIGESFRVPPGRRHRLTALEDCDVLEASTPEIDDIVRLEDRYGRIRGD